MLFKIDDILIYKGKKYRVVGCSNENTTVPHKWDYMLMDEQMDCIRLLEHEVKDAQRIHEGNS